MNTPDWESYPLISSSYIAFQRSYDGEDGRYVDLLVYERSTEETRTLGTWERSGLGTEIGAVGDRYLTQTLRRRSRCDALVYDLQTETRQKIPNLNDKNQQAAVVGEVNSIVYYFRLGPYRR